MKSFPSWFVFLEAGNDSPGPSGPRALRAQFPVSDHTHWSIEKGGKAMNEFTVVLEEGELEAGAMRAVDVDGVRVLVSRSEDGGVCAIANACTHVGGPLDEGERDGNVVACPWHGSRFDLCSGEVLRGPAREPQRRFESRLREGRIEIRSP